MHREIVYPIGDSSFSTIRERGQFYVDKTAYIYRMATTGKYFFLSRPRRFGKSLLLSTMEAYFKGSKQLFSGLAIEGLEKDWKTYPVLHLDLSVGNMKKPDHLKEYLSLRLSDWETRYGCSTEAKSFGVRFSTVIRQAHLQSAAKVVVLVDEYDNPLFSTYGAPSAHEEMHDMLRGIYSVLKAEADHIQFCFLTGITRFSRMSVFSGLNNLRDITLDPSYSGICGITQQELTEYCQEGIGKVSQAYRIDREQAIAKLKEHYDGYHFGDMRLDVYNPYSLIQVFPDGRLDDYWFVSGMSEFLWKQISKLADKRSLLSVLNPIVEKSQLGTTERDGIVLESLLFQTGYLTLKEELEDGWAYRLGIPNREVYHGIFNGLLPLISHRNREENVSDLVRLRQYARNGEVDSMMRHLQSFLASISNRLTKKMPEIYYENNLFILFSLIGISTDYERDTADGRIDLTLHVGDYIYIIELKLDYPACEAMAQIKEKKYWLPYLREEKKILLLGISFSSSTRNITEWHAEELS